MTPRKDGTREAGRRAVHAPPAPTADLPNGDARASPTGVASTSRTIELSEEWQPEHFFRELLGAYLAGADEITVVQRGGVRAPTRTVVRTFVARIGGYPACTESRNRMLLWNFGGAALEELPKLTQQLGQLTIELLRRAGGRGFRPGSEEEPWEALDDPIDRASWAVHRTVERSARSGEFSRTAVIDALGWLEAARAFERIADHAVLIGENGTRWRESGPTESQLALVADFHDRAVDYLRSVLGALSHGRVWQANPLIDLGGALGQTGRTLVDRLVPVREPARESSPGAVVALSWLLHSLERTVAYGQDIAEVLLDHAAPSPLRPVPAVAAGRVYAP